MTDNDKEEEVERKMPEFIYVETGREHQKESFQDFGAEYGSTFQRMARQRFPFVLRLFCLSLAAIVFFACLIALPFMMFFLLVNALSLFRAEQLWKRTQFMWEHLKKLFVSGLGLLIAVFSPAFGFAVIIVYLLIKGGNVDEDWIARMMQQRMSRR